MGTCTGPSFPRSTVSGKRERRLDSSVRDGESVAVRVKERKVGGAEGEVRVVRRACWRIDCVGSEEGVLSLMPAQVTSWMSGSTCGVMEWVLRRAKVRSWSSETVAGGGVLGGWGGKSKEDIEEPFRWFGCSSGDAGFVMVLAPKPLGSSESDSKRKPRSSRAWMTVARALRGTKMKSDQ